MTPPTTQPGNGREASELADWRAQARVFLQPIAAPSILGLFGFASATFMVSAHLTHWYGSAISGRYVFPFAMTFGGLAQLLAGMWAYRARDAVATAAHGTWGAFWLGFGILQLLGATGAIVIPAAKFPEFGYWFLTLAVITAACATAAAGENLGIFSVLAVLAVGAACAAVFYLTGTSGWSYVAGYVLMASSFLATYVATALMLASAWGRVVLPLGELRREANVPGRVPIHPIQFAYGEPGVKQGQ